MTENTKQPQDHLPKKGSDEPQPDTPADVTVEWRGTEFTVPSEVEDWPAEAVEAAENNRGMTACRVLLGEQQWAKVKTVSKATVRDVNELFGLIGEAAGFTNAGE